MVDLKGLACRRLNPVYYRRVNLWIHNRFLGRGRLLLYLQLVYLALWNWLCYVELLFDFWRFAGHGKLFNLDRIQLTPAEDQLVVEERRTVLTWRNNSEAGFPNLISISMRFRLRKVDRSILDRLGHDLCLVFLDGERGAWYLVDPTIFLLLS